MRRAYPQHLTAGGQLPPEMLQVIYPLAYWDRSGGTRRRMDSTHTWLRR